jgi:hypothetical protein
VIPLTPKNRLAVLLVLTLSGAACTGKHNSVTVQNEEPPASTKPALASVVRMNDPQTSAQLVKGFYSIEGGSWRWTAGKFAARLQIPPGAAQSGATLNLNFSVPDAVLQKLGKITITGSINGMALKPAEFEKSGPAIYTADIAPSQLTGDSVEVDFALDKSIPPGATDRRELGVIATSVALVPK